MDLKNQYKTIYFVLPLIFIVAPFFNVQAQRIFWTDRFNDRIMVSDDIIGLSGGTVLTTGLSNVDMLEVDDQSGFIVVTLNGNEGLYRLNINGTNLVEVRDFGSFTGFTNIEVNPDDGLIYGSELNGGVFYYDVNEGAPFTETQMTMAGVPTGAANDDYTGIAYNSSGNNVYLSRPAGSDIFVTSDALGDNVAGGFQGRSPDLIEIDTDNNKLYYVEGDQLSRSNLDLNAPELLVDAGTQIFDIEIYPNLGVYYCTNVGIYFFDFELESNTLLLTQSGVRGLGALVDFSRPTVQSFIPNPGQSGVAIGATQFSMTFNEDVQISSNTASGTDTQIRVFRNGGLFETIDRTSANLTVVDNVLSIDLNNALTVGDYHVLIGGNVISNLSKLDYTGISNTTTWSFTVECDDPTIQASGLARSNIGNGSFDLSWVNGNGDHTIILAKNGSPVDTPPTDLTTYGANSSFGVGDEIGSGNFVVFNGTGNTERVTNLPDGITHFAAYSYNAANSCYLSTSPITVQGPDFSANFATVSQSGPGNIDLLSADQIMFTYEISGGSSDMLTTGMTFVTGGFNQITDLTQLFSDLWLTDDAGNRHNLSDGGTLTANNLTLNNFNTTGIGNVPGGGTKVYELHAQFLPTLGGGLAQTVDNMTTEFELFGFNFTYDDNTGSAHRTEIVGSAASGQNFIRVVATEIGILQQPSTTVDQLAVLPQQPVFESTDANGNRDLDFVDTIVVGTTNPDDLSPTSSPTSFTLGLIDFAASGFNFVDAGTSTMNVMASPSGISSPNTNSITVNAIPPTLALSNLEVIDNTSCSMANGSIEVVSIDPGLISNYTFNLEDESGMTVAGSGPLFSGLVAGNYFITATNNTSSLSTSPLSVTVGEMLAMTLIPDGVDNNICEGETLPDFEIILGAASSEVIWYDDDPNVGGNVINNSNGINSPTLPATDFPGGISGTGVFRVFASYIDASTFCESGAVGSRLQINTVPSGVLEVTSDFGGFGVSCSSVSDGEVQITASGGTAPYTFTLVETSETQSGSNPATFTNLAAGDYTVMISDVNSCEVTSNTVSITAPMGITASIDVTSDYNGTPLSCSDIADGEITVAAANGTPPFNYTLVELPGNTTGASNGIFTGVPAGSYSVMITDQNDCPFTTTSVNLVAPTAISGSLSESQVISCAGNADGEITATVSGGTGTLTYVLNEIAANTSGASNGVFTGLAQGNYTVTVTDVNNCSFTTPSFSLDDPAAYSATLSRDVDICAQEIASLDLQITGGAAPYNVEVDGLGTISYSGTGTFDITVSTTITINILSITDANGCAASNISGSSTITVFQDPTVSNAGDAQEVCEDMISLSANSPSVGLGIWQLVSGSGVIADPSDPNTTVSQISAGDNIFSWTISNGTCEASSSEVTITKLSTPIGEGIISSASGNNEFCPETDVVLNVTGVNDVTTYTWTLLDGGTTVTNEPSVAFSVPNGIRTGVVTVVGENICGVGTVSQEFNVTVLSSPDVTINIPSLVQINLGTAFTFTSDEAISNVSWDFGDGNTSTDENPTHTYTEIGSFQVSITGSSVNGCPVSGTANITVNPADPISIKNAITPNGDGANDQLIIDNIEFYPDNTVTLFDRWGVEVARFTGYNNDWDLTNDGELIPAGNYICVVELPSIDDVVKRTITVVRSSN